MARRQSVTGVEMIIWECPECEERNELDASTHAPQDVECQNCGCKCRITEVISY